MAGTSIAVSFSTFGASGGASVSCIYPMSHRLRLHVLGPGATRRQLREPLRRVLQAAFLNAPTHVLRPARD
eukprot:9112316-Pyramimonas_sp.AAC.1